MIGRGNIIQNKRSKRCERRTQSFCVVNATPLLVQFGFIMSLCVRTRRSRKLTLTHILIMGGCKDERWNFIAENNDSTFSGFIPPR